MASLTNYCLLTYPISASSCSSVINWLYDIERARATDKEIKKLPYHLHIASDGGDFTPAAALIRAIKLVRFKVDTICLGYVGSAAAYIWANGNRRIVHRGDEVMFHPSSFSVEGTHAKHQESLRSLRWTDKFLLESIKNRVSALGYKTISKAIREDRELTLSGKEAHKLGIATDLI